MTTQGDEPMSTVPAERPQRHALGLPAGSVRALLAFGVLAYMWILALSKGKDGGSLLGDDRVATSFVYLQMLMVLILAHFFVAHGKTIGSHISRSSPLGMPRGSVRFLLLGGYLGLAYFMFVTRPPFQVPVTMPVLLMLAVLVTCFIVGHGITKMVVWFASGKTPAWFQDIQAWFALMGMVVLGIVVIFRLVINYSLPLEDQVNLDVIEAILAGIVGFYFGARS
jgi:hypothetical protein